MSEFTVRDGQFWLDGQPVLLQAGEFHYFRTPRDQWAHRLGLLKQAGFNTVAAYIPWLWHQPQPDVSDLDGQTHPLRNLAGFLDLAATLDLYIIARPGPYIMAETINEGVPPWVFAAYPQAAYISQTGQPQNIASYLQADFLRCVEGWYAAVFRILAPRQITRGGKLIMVQLDNEMGMIQWLRNTVDVNPDTCQRMADDLHTRYGAALAARYPTADLPAFLREQFTQPQAPYAAQVIADYRRFYRTYLRDYLAHLWQRAQAHGLEVPPVVNIHGFGNGGKTFPIGLSQLVEAMSLPGMVSATDVYPIFIGEGNAHQLVLVNELTKALHNPQQALFSIEFQAGGNLDFGGAQSSLYDLHSRLCISCGMRAINHYLFFDGENHPVLSPTQRHDWGHPVRKDGTLRPHYARYPQLSRVLAAYGTDLVQAQPKTVCTIGFLLDDYLTEVNNAATRPATDRLTHQRDVILFDFIARGLTLTHRPYNALELSRAALDVTTTPVLWVMLEQQCDAPTQRKLVEYVRQGGQLVLVGRMCVETFDHTPCTLLQQALGVQAIHAHPLSQPDFIHAFEQQNLPAAFVESYTGDFANVFATTLDGQPAGFEQRLGDGTVLMLGAALTAHTLAELDVFSQLAQRVGCAPLFQLDAWADVRVSAGAHGSFLFINHYQDDPLTTHLADATGAALFGGHAVHLPARRGAILPLDWQVCDGVTMHYATAEITGVTEEASRLLLHTAQPDCVIELSLTRYTCADALVLQRAANRVTLRLTDGTVSLFRT